jgi:hypothetical protein
MLHLTFVAITLSVVTADQMARNIAALLLTASLASCMEMRETVERMVMVRTSGSDLQPAATGYIYKKDNDGHASVVKMGESEIMKQLSQLYKEPESYAAPVPAAKGPFPSKDEDDDKAASHTDERVIPVVEKADDRNDDVDGIADDDDFSKIFKEYAANFGHYNSDFADYLHGLGHFEDGIYHGGHGRGKSGHGNAYKGYEDDDTKGYASKHYYGQGSPGDYIEKYESYSISGKGDKKSYGDDDAYGKHFVYGKGHKAKNHGHKSPYSEGEAVNGFFIYDKDERNKHDDVYDKEEDAGRDSKHADRHAYHGSAAGEHKEGDAHKSGNDEDHFGKEGVHEQKGGNNHGEYTSDKDGKSHHDNEGKFGAKSAKYDGKSYGFQIKH